MHLAVGCTTEVAPRPELPLAGTKGDQGRLAGGERVYVSPAEMTELSVFLLRAAAYSIDVLKRIDSDILSQTRSRIVVRDENLGSALHNVLGSFSVDSLISRLGLERARLTDEKRASDNGASKPGAAADKRVKELENKLNQQTTKSERLERENNSWHSRYKEQSPARRYSERRTPSSRREPRDARPRDSRDFEATVAAGSRSKHMLMMGWRWKEDIALKTLCRAGRTSAPTRHS